MYENLLFDLDGTLTNSSSGIIASIAYALNKMNVKVPGADILNSFLGPPLLDSFIKYCGMQNADAARAVDYYRDRYSKKGLYENTVYPGIHRLLEMLSARGTKLYLATSKPKVYADKILEYFGLSGFFIETFGCGLDGALHEKSEVIAYAMKKQSIAAESAVMIGDRKYDILGAKVNNIKSIGVLYGYGSPAELIEAGADIIAESVEELGGLLLSNKA